MKITIDTADRHNIDGVEYVRITALDGVLMTSREPVKLIGHVASAKVVHHRKKHYTKRRMATPGSNTPTAAAMQAKQSTSDLVKQRNQEYEDRAAATHAEAAMKENKRQKEAKAAENTQGRPRTMWTEVKCQMLIDLVRAGQPYSEIGKKLGTSEGAVTVQVSALKKMGRLPKIRHHVTTAA